MSIALPLLEDMVTYVKKVRWGGGTNQCHKWIARQTEHYPVKGLRTRKILDLINAQPVKVRHAVRNLFLPFVNVKGLDLRTTFHVHSGNPICIKLLLAIKVLVFQPFFLTMKQAN